MFPANTTFTYLPDDMSASLLALARQLPLAGRDAPHATLGPIAILRELKVICASMMSGRGGPNTANRASLADDLSKALNALGPETTKAAGPALTDFLSEISKLKHRLDSPQGARVLALALGPVNDRLATSTVLVAAWRDTVDAFQDTDVTAECCELRLRQLAELAEHRGVDFDVRADTLVALLTDHAGVLESIGERVPPADSDVPRPGNVPEARRLELCEQVLTEVPRPASGVAVWIVIEEAALQHGFLNKGSMLLFAQHHWSDGLRKGVADGTFPDLPEVSSGEMPADPFEYLEPGRHRLLARFWVESMTAKRARDHAHGVVRALIDVAKPDSHWKLLDGAMSWTSEDGWYMPTFTAPETRAAASKPVHPVFDRTREGVEEVSDDFIRRWLRQDTVALDAIDDALWTVSVERAPGAPQRIVLAIRALERTLSRARERQQDSWSDAARRYLRRPWVHLELRNEMLAAGHAAAEAIPGKHEFNDALYQEVHREIWGVAEDGISYFSENGLAAAASRSLSALPEASMAARIVSAAERVLSTPEAARDRVRILGERFDRLLARTERQRNGLVHGTGVEPMVLESVDDFVRVLARLVAHEAMSQAETGDEPLVHLERLRVRALDDDARLESGEDPLDVLFSSVT